MGAAVAQRSFEGALGLQARTAGDVPGVSVAARWQPELKANPESVMNILEKDDEEPCTKTRSGRSGSGNKSSIGGTKKARKKARKKASAVFNANLKRGSLKFSMGSVIDGLMQCPDMPNEDRVGGADADNRELCVSGLPPDCKELDLYKMFAPFGALPMRGISIMKLPNGDCKGSAFVLFLDSTEAQRAIDTLHETVMPDRPYLKVYLNRNNHQ